MLWHFTVFFITAFWGLSSTASLLHDYSNLDTLPNEIFLSKIVINILIIIVVILTIETSKDEIRQGTVSFRLSVIAFISFFARFFVFNIQGANLGLFASCNFYLATLFLCFYCLFVHPLARRYTWKSNQSNVFGFIFCAILVAHGYFLYQNIKSAMGYEMYQAMVFYHVALGLICVSSTLESFAILAGRMELKENDKLESVKVVSKKAKTSSALKDEKKKDAEKNAKK